MVNEASEPVRPTKITRKRRKNKKRTTFPVRKRLAPKREERAIKNALRVKRYQTFKYLCMLTTLCAVNLKSSLPDKLDNLIHNGNPNTYNYKSSEYLGRR